MQTTRAVAVVVFLAGCAVHAQQVSPAVPAHKALVVKLAPGYQAAAVAGNFQASGKTGLAELDTFLNNWALVRVAPVFGRAGVPPRDPEAYSRLGLDRFLEVGWTKGSAPRTAQEIELALTQARQLKPVELAEANGVGSGGMIPNDPLYSSQWHHGIIGSTQAWDFATGTDAITIAVVDSGLCFTNSDFDYSLVTNGYDYVDDDWVPQDGLGHGTHVAGIACAAGNNTNLVAGLAWNCRLLVIRVINSSDFCYWTDTAAGIEEAADRGAQVINLSIQGSSYSAVLGAACTYAHGLNSFLAACMGNWDSCVTSYPAAFPETVAVGMTESNDYRAGNTGGSGTFTGNFGSNYGPHNDVVAPGYGILSTWYDTTNTYYGTSMATPMVSALAALLLQLRPDWTNEALRTVIELTAEDEVGEPTEDVPGFDDYMGYGRIRFGLAVQLASLSSTCTLTYVSAFCGGGAPALLKPFYWLRDEKLALTPRGRELVRDYYRTGAAVAGVVQRRADLTVRLLNLALAGVPLIDGHQKNPGAVVRIPRKLWQESCAVSDQVMPLLPPAAWDILQPWVTRGKQNPLGLLQDLGIRAAFAN